MNLKLHTKSRDGLYEASAILNGTVITVLKGSRINTNNSAGYKPSEEVSSLRRDKTRVDIHGYLLEDIDFNSLSAAATFVTGRIANGMIVWKTEDGKNVRYTIKSTD